MLCRIVKVCCDALALQPKFWVYNKNFFLRIIDFNENQRLLCSTVASELRTRRRNVYRHTQVVVLQVCVFIFLCCYVLLGEEDFYATISTLYLLQPKHKNKSKLWWCWWWWWYYGMYNNNNIVCESMCVYIHRKNTKLPPPPPLD